MTTSSSRRNAAFAADTDYADVVPRGDTWVRVAKSLVIVVMRQFAKGQDRMGSGKLKGVRAVCEGPIGVEAVLLLWDESHPHGLNA